METRRLTVELGLPGGRARVEMDVPTGEVPMEGLLPALRATADALVAFAADRSAAEGKPVSCGKGCGACCRQLVPLAHAEARSVAAILDGLEEPRRSEVRRRFAEAGRKVEAAGLLPALEGQVMREPGLAVAIGKAYLALGIACPFLEDESCTIYDERPIACREYLVSSSPALCAAPTAGSVATVPLPTRVWAAAAREELGVADTDPAPCVTLVLAPGWAARHHDARSLLPGPELLRSVYERFARDRRDEGPAA